MCRFYSNVQKWLMYVSVITNAKTVWLIHAVLLIFVATVIRGIHKICRWTLLITGYVHHNWSLFIIVFCSWNALFQVFLQRFDSVIEELADNIFIIANSFFSCILSVSEIHRSHLEPNLMNIMCEGVFLIWHFTWCHSFQI